MRVIARIPDCSEPQAPAGAGTVAAGPAASPAPPPRPPRSARGVTRRDRRERPWPSWPVAALAVIAALAWIMATWNDHERLRRQRGGERVALEPVAASGADAPVATPRGAVIR